MNALGRRRLVLSACIVAATWGVSACGSSHHAGTKADETAQLKLANTQQQRGNLAAAEAGYRRVLSINPKNNVALYDLGLIAQDRGQLPLARQDYLASVAVAPTYEPALYNLGTVLAKLGSTNAAIGYYRRAIAVKPADAAAHYNLGLLLLQTGDKTAGTAELAEAHNIEPALQPPSNAPKATPHAVRQAPTKSAG